MNERPTSSLDKLVLRYSSYWRCVIGFGLPFIVIYRAIDYVIYRSAIGEGELRYPWRVVALLDISYMFVISTIWWFLLRQLKTRQRKDG
jgi:hypothetical protein